MSIDRKLIRQNFLKMKEAENIKIKEDENIKKQIQDEINNQNNEIKLMRHEDRTQQRIMFYEKIKAVLYFLACYTVILDDYFKKYWLYDSKTKKCYAL